MSSKIKVLQVIPKLGYGGAETGCYDLAHYLAENNCSSYIVTSGGSLIKFIDTKKVKLIRLPVHSKNPILMIFNFIALTFIILFCNISIIHARSRAPAWSSLLAAKLTRRKFVTTFHGTYNFKNKIKKFYNSIMLRSNLIIAGSNFIFSHIKENYSKLLDTKKKFLVIFRGINIDYFDASTVTDMEEDKLLNQWGLDRDKKLVIMPGRLSNWKGQEIFIEAINLVNRDLGYLPFYSVILGSDQGRDVYKKKLVRLVEQHRLTNNLKFVNNCKDMAIAYKISDIVVSASTEPEAFGRVSVEAQSMKKPIIASNIGGSKETIIDNKTGFLFESGKPQELSKKIIEILQLDESTLKSMGNEGRKNVIKKFNVEKMCLSTYSEYKKLLDANN